MQTGLSVLGAILRVLSKHRMEILCMRTGVPAVIRCRLKPTQLTTSLAILFMETQPLLVAKPQLFGTEHTLRSTTPKALLLGAGKATTAKLGKFRPSMVKSAGY